MDVVDAAVRSRMMAGIKSKNTQPEMVVRKFLHANGLRFRLHSKKLPGSPDLLLPKFKVAIFVHGCFWHRHLSCRYAYNPKSNIERWNEKFQANIERDARTSAAYENLHWTPIIVWECELRHNPEARLSKLIAQIFEAAPTGSRAI